MHILLVVFALIAAVWAQVGPQASLLPQCIKTCDPPAIASVNCTNADQHCHCVRYAGILSNITACADVTCSNASASLYTFTTLFEQICSQFNLTVPILGSNATNTSSTNVTYTPAPSASVAPFQGSANSQQLNPQTIGMLLLGSLTATGLLFGTL